MDAARVGRLAGITEIFFLAPVFREIGQSIKTADGHPGNCCEAGVAVLVYVYSSGRTYRVLGSLFEGGRKGFLSPVLFRGGGMPVLENVSDRTFSHLRLRLLFLHTDPSVLL